MSATIASSDAVAAVILGLGISQYPAIIPPGVTSFVAEAPDNVLRMILGVVTLAVLLLFPALVCLLVLFKGSR